MSLAQQTAQEIAQQALMLNVGTEGAPAQIITVTETYQMPSLGKAVCSIGAFDGVHVGHQFLISEMLKDAQKRGVPSVIVTFDKDPDELFLPTQQVKKLLNNTDRITRLAHTGADYVVVVPFTYELARLGYAEFLETVLGRVFEPVALHVGSDFRLGSQGAGTLERVKSWGASHNCEVFGYDLLCGDEIPVSSTRIRRLLIEGDLPEAKRYLGRDHYIRGRVVQGRQKGRTFGIPTANIELTYPYQMPGEAVYAGLVLVDDVLYPSAMSVGIPPTFASEENCGTLEPFLLGFEGTLYDKDVAVIFCNRLRDMRKFLSIEELIATVEHNIAQTKDLFGENPIPLW